MTVLGRDAVVIIHGIGEQVPLETVRGFVGRTTARAHDGQPADAGVAGADDRVFSEPSPVGGRTDDRAYVVTWSHAAAADEIAGQPDPWAAEKRSAVTDFYEFYWAPHYRSTTFAQLTGWLLPLLIRPLSSFQSPRLVGRRGIIRWAPPILFALALVAAIASQAAGISWIAGISVVAVLLLAGIFVGTTLGLVGTFHVLALAAVVWAVCCVTVFGFADAKSIAQAVGSSVVVAFALRWLGVRVTRVLGDAARYLSSTPDSVEENDAIRQQVLLLLDNLHDVRDPDTRRMRYDRIIVVGHSLGSVIAYDAVRLLWTRRYRSIELPALDDGTPAGLALAQVEAAGTDLSALADRADHSAQAMSESLERFRAAQRELQLVLRDPVFADPSDAAQPRWIITDLITLGSPLAYADAFMAHNLGELRDRFEDRSLVRNPPVSQQVRQASGHPYRLRTPDYDEVKGTTRLHHAAPFACVQWTNLYFDHDIVGGPLAVHFGPGIADVPLGGSHWLGAFAFAYPHSSYWTASRRRLVRDGSERSLAFLRSTLRRPPVLLMTAERPLDASAVKAIAALLVAPAPEALGPEIQVRLYVQHGSALPQGAYLPVGRVRLPPHSVLPELARLLGAGGRVSLLSNPDPLVEVDVPPADPYVASQLPTRDRVESDTVGEEE